MQLYAYKYLINKSELFEKQNFKISLNNVS